jgi:hypothetical protein
MGVVTITKTITSKPILVVLQEGIILASLPYLLAVCEGEVSSTLLDTGKS